MTLAALYDLEVKEVDVLNAYVMASNRNNTWTICSLEFGGNAGKYTIIIIALFGLKSTVTSFTAHLAQCMQEQWV